MQSTDDIFRKLIKPLRDEYVQSVLRDIDVEDFSPWDRHLNWGERMGPIKRLRDQFTSWSSSWLKGLEDFQHMYVVNGNTDALNILFGRHKNIAWREGDYSYYKYWHNATGRTFHELTQPRAIEDLVVTWPGYSNGGREEVDFALTCGAARLHLDCAYLGLTKPDTLDLSPFHTASFSFSKTLSIPYNRVAVMFSRTEITECSILNKLGYVNLGGVRLVNRLLDKIPVDYWWNTYGGRLADLCSSNGLTSTNCILFAYNGSSRIALAPYWK